MKYFSLNLNIFAQIGIEKQNQKEFILFYYKFNINFNINYSRFNQINI